MPSTPLMGHPGERPPTDDRASSALAHVAADGPRRSDPLAHARSARVCTDPITVACVDLTCTREEATPWMRCGTPPEEAKKTDHPILQHIHLKFRPGQLVGILGASGSGKTTLLQLLAARGGVRQSSKLSGQILFNGAPASQYAASTHAGEGAAGTTTDSFAQTKELARRIGYVMQQDFLLPHSTVYETLLYAARFRLARHLTDDQRRARVDEVLTELNLQPLRDSLIGGEDVRGLSGGERRLVSVGVQILTDPSVLFSDEPTTGLDSFTAKAIIECFASLAHHQKRTVVCTIHQPRAEIFHAFDQIVLLVKGCVVYQGSPARAIEFFENQGYALPQSMNPADHMIDTVTISGSSSTSGGAGRGLSERDVSVARVRSLKRAYDQQTAREKVTRAGSLLLVASESFGASHETSQTLFGASRLTQIGDLVRRDFVDLLRNRSYLLASLVEVTFVGLLLGLIFMAPPFTLAGIRSRTAMLYMAASLHYYLIIIQYVYKFSQDLPVADHEREDHMYGVTAFVLSRVLIYFPFHVVFSCLYVVIFYFLCDLRLEAGAFFVTVGGACLLQHAAVGIALMCVCLQRSFAQASLIANSLYTFFGLSTGFLVASEAIPPWVSWMQPLAFTWYGWRLFATNEYSNRMLPCPDDAPAGEPCLPQTHDGNEILHANSLGVDDFTWPPIAIAIVWLVVTVVGALALRLLPNRGSLASEMVAEAGAAGAPDEFVDLMAEMEEEAGAPSSATSIQPATLLDSSPDVDGRMPIAPVVLSTIDHHLAGGEALGDGSPMSGVSEVLLHNSPEASPKSLRLGAMPPRDYDRLAEFPLAVQPAATAAVDIARTRALVDPSAAPLMASIHPSYSPAASVHPARPLITMEVQNLSLDVDVRRLFTCGGLIKTSSSSSSSDDNATASVDYGEHAPPLAQQSPNSHTTNSRKKKILDRVTCTIEPGLLTVILGSSGAGKSSLLDLLAHRSTLTRGMTGRILFNGTELAPGVWQSLVGYVTQADHLLPFLTVRETLAFAAHLRMPPGTSRADREARVHSVLDELGLQSCANTLIGNASVKGCSGGEIRRVSIGCSLITDPALLLLDEPTSGLDSYTAQQITRTLVSIARRGRTVIASMHQPRSDVYAQFDRILLMAPGGHLVFFGSRQQVAPYFASEPLRMVCPEHVNPADFLLDHSALDHRSKESARTTRERNARLIAAFRAAQEEGRMTDGGHRDLEAGAAAPTGAPSENGAPVPSGSRSLTRPGSSSGSAPTPLAVLARAPFGLAFHVLVHRSWINFARQPLLVSARVGQILAFAVILVLYYARLGYDQYSVQNRLGLVQEFNAVLFIGMLNCIAVFIAERNLFYREHADRAYSTLPFFLSYFVTEVAFEVAGCLAFTVLAMFVIGMTPTAASFFILAFVLLCVVNAGESFGIVFCAIVHEPGISVSITNCVFTLFTVMAGVFSLTMPTWLQRINYISVMRYGVRIVARYELEGKRFHCRDDQRIPTGGAGSPLACPFSTGEQVLALYDFDDDSDLLDLLACGLLAIAYRIIAYVVLAWSAHRKTHAA